MASVRRADRLPHKVQTDPLVRYFLWGVAGALLLVAVVVIRQVSSGFNLESAFAGALILVVLVGSAYVLLSLSLQNVVVFPDRLVLARWLFLDPETVYFARVRSLEQGTVGPIEVLNVYQLAEPAPLRLLDLYRREDIFFIVGAFEASRSPAPTDPDILRRAQSLREGRDDPAR